MYAALRNHLHRLICVRWRPSGMEVSSSANTRTLCRRRRMQFSITTEIDAPPEVVFAVLSQVERFPEWTPTVTRVERTHESWYPTGPLVDWIEAPSPPNTR